MLLKNFLRPLNNSFFRHSGLDPESRKSLKPLGPCLRRYDIITIFVTFCKGLHFVLLKKTVAS
jgi:hypothetical protein